MVPRDGEGSGLYRSASSGLDGASDTRTVRNNSSLPSGQSCGDSAGLTSPPAVQATRSPVFNSFLGTALHHSGMKGELRFLPGSFRFWSQFHPLT